MAFLTPRYVLDWTALCELMYGYWVCWWHERKIIYVCFWYYIIQSISPRLNTKSTFFLSPTMLAHKRGECCCKKLNSVAEG